MFMSVWKKKLLGGIERVFRDGHAVVDPDEIASLPAAVRRLDVGDSVEFEDSAPLPPEQPIIETPSAKEALKLPTPEPHVSVLSGEPADRRRFLNGVEYWLTDEEYEKYNLGKLAQALREKAAKTVEDKDE